MRSFLIPAIIACLSACGDMRDGADLPKPAAVPASTAQDTVPPATTGHRTPNTEHLPDTKHRTPDTSYDFTKPDAVFELDNDLEEISGLTVFDDRHLAAVEDEHGRFYLIDYETGEITAERKFGRKGDYEGIEMADGRLFVLRSDGQMRELIDFNSDEPEDDEFDLPLNSSCDAEGLAHQQSDKRLLVACKEQPAKGLHGLRAIYAVSLESLEMQEAPVYFIRNDTVHSAVGSPGSALRKLLAPIADLDGFKPSGLAVHPVTDHVFVLSSVLKVIVVLTPDGTVESISIIDEDLLRQPEGLAFLSSGDLFIASEGAGGKARLIRFNYRPS